MVRQRRSGTWNVAGRSASLATLDLASNDWPDQNRLPELMTRHPRLMSTADAHTRFQLRALSARIPC